MLNLYITSTNKGEGKTFLTAGIAATMQGLGYSTQVYKPIQTSGIEINGFMQSPDLTLVKSMDPYIATSFTYLFKTDDIPLIAAENENEFIDIEIINKDFQRAKILSDCVIVDGINGFLTPIAPSIKGIDMLKQLQIPTLLVVKPDNNSINNTLDSIYIALNNEIHINGVIINDIDENCSKNLLTSLTRVIEEYTNVKILGLIPHLEKITPDEMIANILNGTDLESVFRVKIEKLRFN